MLPCKQFRKLPNLPTLKTIFPMFWLAHEFVVGEVGADERVRKNWTNVWDYKKEGR